jgi:hypothetical protein
LGGQVTIKGNSERPPVTGFSSEITFAITWISEHYCVDCLEEGRSSALLGGGRPGARARDRHRQEGGDIAAKQLLGERPVRGRPPASTFSSCSWSGVSSACVTTSQEVSWPRITFSA